LVPGDTAEDTAALGVDDFGAEEGHGIVGHLSSGHFEATKRALRLMLQPQLVHCNFDNLVSAISQSTQIFNRASYLLLQISLQPDDRMSEIVFISMICSLRARQIPQMLHSSRKELPIVI
jgi:hypothetical protein